MTKEERLNAVISFCIVEGVDWELTKEGNDWGDIYDEFVDLELENANSGNRISDVHQIPGNVKLVARGLHHYHYAAAALFLLIEKYPEKYSKYGHLIERLNEIGDKCEELDISYMHSRDLILIRPI